MMGLSITNARLTWLDWMRAASEGVIMVFFVPDILSSLNKEYCVDRGSIFTWIAV